MNVEKQINLQLISDWIHLIGVEAVSDRFIPTYTNNWQWCAKNDLLPENGGRKRLDQIMKAMNRIRNCLISTYNDKPDMTNDEKSLCRLRNLQRYATSDILVISKILN